MARWHSAHQIRAIVYRVYSEFLPSHPAPGIARGVCTEIVCPSRTEHLKDFGACCALSGASRFHIKGEPRGAREGGRERQKSNGMTRLPVVAAEYSCGRECLTAPGAAETTRQRGREVKESFTCSKRTKEERERGRGGG